jgi:hypothetical protein
MRRSVLAPVIALAVIALPLSLSAGSARAADEAAKSEAAPAKSADSAEIEKAMASNPYKDDMQEKAKQLSAALGDKEVKNLGVLLQSFGMVRSVHVAHDKVHKAVEKCAAANADLSQKINERYNDWDSKLTPKMAEQEKKMSDTLASDKFTHATEIKAYLDIIDKAAAYADEQQKTEVVTTPDACKGLMESMDKTGPTLTQILDEMKWPTEAITAADAPAAASPAKEEAPAAAEKPAEETKTP